MNFLFQLRLKQHIIRNLFKAYYYDANRFYKFATQIDLNEYPEKRLTGYIIAKYHIIEKGLSMPDMRPGFGKQAVEAVIDSCTIYYQKYGKSNCQVNYAVSVLGEYLKVHDQINFVIEKSISDNILFLQNQNPENCETDNSIQYKAINYFNSKDASFPEFALSRHSLRSYSIENIELEAINKAVELCQNTTPTSCNRQAIRINIVTDKEKIHEVLSIQTGNRGFGHLTNKLIVLCTEISVYNEVRERNLAYVDGGIYAMNLMYALHHFEIGNCPLNWSANIDADKKIREILNIPESEVVFLVLTCGKPADDFRLAKSKRFNYTSVTKYI